MLRSRKKNCASKASLAKSNSKKTAAAPTQTPEPPRKRISTVTPSPPGPSIARASVIDDPSSLQLDNDDNSTLPKDLFCVLMCRSKSIFTVKTFLISDY